MDYARREWPTSCDRRVRPRTARWTLPLIAALLALASSLPAQDSSRVRVDLAGVDAEQARNIRLVLELARESATGKLTHTRIVHLHRRAETEIETALRPFGYYDPRIVKSLQPGAAEWVALYVIDPGVPVRVRSVTIELNGPGADSAAFQSLVTNFPLHKGDTLRDQRYEAGKLTFLTAATDSGYLDANFDTTAVVVDRDAHTADIVLRFDTGPRYKFGPVRFEQDFLDEGLLRKRIPFKQGQPYRQRKLLELQTALSEDPYFARVEVLPQQKEAQDLEVPIRVLLEPRKLWTYEFGAGYGTDTGPRGRSIAMWRRINSAGHYAEAGVVLSQIEQTGWGRYNIPGIGHKAGVFTLIAGFSRAVPRNHIASRSYLGGARIFRHRLGWAETVSLTFQRSGFEIGVDTGKVNLLIPGVTWERTKADNRMFPRRGIRTQVEIQGATKGVASTVSFLQLKGSAKVVYGFAPGFRILARADLGRSFAREFHKLPPQFRFFTGGDVSVRGFSYASLAPRDSLGNVLGGQSLLVGSAEVDYRFLQPVGDRRIRRCRKRVREDLVQRPGVRGGGRAPVHLADRLGPGRRRLRDQPQARSFPASHHHGAGPVSARRVLLGLVIGLGGLILVVALGVTIAFSSPAVAKKVIAWGLGKSKGLEIAEIRGALKGPIYLFGVSYRSGALTAQVDSVLLDWHPIRLLLGRIDLNRLYAAGVRLTLPDSAPPDTAGTAKARLQRPQTPFPVVLGDVSIRGIEINAPGQLTLRSGELKLSGLLSHYRFDLRGTGFAPTLGTVVAHLTGTGGLEQVTLDSSTATVLQGAASATGKVGWWPTVSWDLAVTGDSIRPAPFFPQPGRWPGYIAFRLTTSGVIDSSGPVGQAKLDSLGGRLRGQPLAGHAEVAFAPGGYDLPALDVNWGSARLVAHGILHDTVSVSYDLAITDLRTATRRTRGSLTLTGTARGPRRTPRIVARLEARNLVQGGNRLRHLAGTADLDLAPRGRLDVELRGEQGGLGKTQLDTLRASLHGRHSAHTLLARARGPRDSLRLALAGGFTGSVWRWRGRVNSLAVSSATLGGWQLTVPAALAASRYSGGRLGTLCLVGDSTAGGRICASGDWRSTTTWNVLATVEGIPANRLPVGRSASLNAHGDLVGTLAARLDGHAQAGRLQGVLRVEADSVAYVWGKNVDRAIHRLALDSAVVAIHADRATGLTATLGARLSDEHRKELAVLAGSAALPSSRMGSHLLRQPVTWKLDGSAPDLRFLEPFVFGVDSLQGGVVLGASGSGSLRAPQVQGTLGLQKFVAALPGHRAASGGLELVVNGGLGLDRTLNGEIRLSSRGFGWDYWYYAQPRRMSVDSGSVALKADAGGVHGSVALGVTDAKGKGVASLTGTLELPEYRRLGTRLAPQPVGLTLAAKVPDLAVLQPLMLSADSLAGTVSLEVTAHGRVGAPNLAGTLRVDSARGRLPTGTMARGGLSGDLQLDVANDHTMNGSLRLEPRDLQLQYPVGRTVAIVRMDSTALTLRAEPDGVHGALDLTFADSTHTVMGTLRGRAALPQLRRIDAPLGPQPVTASLEGRASDLAFLETLTPQVDSVAGRMNLDVRLDGNLSNLHTVGSVELADVATRFPFLGILLEGIQFKGHGDQAGSIAFDGRAQSGGGELVLSGSTPVQPSSAHPGHVHLTATRFEVMDNAQLHALLSGTAEVRLAEDSLDIRGDIQVPLARLVLTRIPETAVSPSDDVILVDSLLVLRRNRPVSAQVRITLGDSVSFSGFNFDAELGGSLLLKQTADELPTATGTMYIEEGHYRAYGQDLTIRKGEVRFAGGPLDNPELAVTATRITFNGADRVVVGIRILGNLKDPDVTLISEPPMSETQVLSYILTGGPVGAGAGGSLLDRALTSLGLKNGSLLGPTLGQQVGLTQAKLSTASDVRGSGLAFGRFLSPALYVSYGMGLFDPVGTLRLRYVLSNRFTLLAETGKVTSADILMKTESGKKPR